MNIQRDNWVDYAKAIGIIIVVYGHVARGLYNAGIPMDKNLHLLIDTFIYSFHIPLFFFLSGLYFVKSLNSRTTKQFVFNKIDTLVYPYLLWSIIQGTVEAFLASHTNGNVTYTEVFSLLWQPRAQFWFLYALALVFIFSLLLYRYFNITKINVLLLIGLSLYLIKGYLPFSIYTNYICSYFIYFSLGMYFQQYNSKITFSNSMLLLVIILFITFQYITLFHSIDNFNVLDSIKLLKTILSIAAVVFISKLLSKTNLQFIAHIGKAFMAIYLLHILAGSSIRVFLQKVLGNNIFEVHLILGILAGIIVPIFCVYYSKKLRLPFIESAPKSKIGQLLHLKVKK